MAYGLPDGHVTDDVTWPWKVKLVTTIRLERNISKTAGFTDCVPKEHNRKWHMDYQMVTWPMTSRDPWGCCEAIRSAILAVIVRDYAYDIFPVTYVTLDEGNVRLHLVTIALCFALGYITYCQSLWCALYDSNDQPSRCVHQNDCSTEQYCSSLGFTSNECTYYRPRWKIYSLPLPFRSSDSLATFKSRLKSHLFSSAYHVSHS